MFFIPGISLEQRTGCPLYSRLPTLAVHAAPMSTLIRVLNVFAVSVPARQTTDDANHRRCELQMKETNHIRYKPSSTQTIEAEDSSFLVIFLSMWKHPMKVTFEYILYMIRRKTNKIHDTETLPFVGSHMKGQKKMEASFPGCLGELRWKVNGTHCIRH